jgi:hypothetical protein
MIRARRTGGELAGFDDLVSELKRRRASRAPVGWGIFSFAVLQGVEPVLHAFHLPEWTLTAGATVGGPGISASAERSASRRGR